MSRRLFASILIVHRRGGTGIWLAAAAIFLLIAGVGAATSYVGKPSNVAGSEDTDGEVLAHAKDYARSLGNEKPASTAADGRILPDVNTMIERLAARLEIAPEDVQGWRMLGWSYFNTERYDDAAAAYAKAAELDPSSAELKLAYEEAKAKASESPN